MLLIIFLGSTKPQHRIWTAVCRFSEASPVAGHLSRPGRFAVGTRRQPFVSRILSAGSSFWLTVLRVISLHGLYYAKQQTNVKRVRQNGILCLSGIVPNGIQATHQSGLALPSWLGHGGRRGWRGLLICQPQGGADGAAQAVALALAGGDAVRAVHVVVQVSPADGAPAQ